MASARQRLILTGKKLLMTKGASSLSIRELTKRAGVNLGMFSYHFKSKDQFIHLLLESIYANLLVQLEEKSLDNIDDPLLLLENQLLIISTFARDNRMLIMSLLGDILAGERVVQKFVRLKMKKHFVMLSKSIKSCQKRELIIDAPTPFIIMQIVGSIGLSNLIPELLKRTGINKVFQVALGAVTQKIISDQALKLKVHITMQGLKQPCSMEIER